MKKATVVTGIRKDVTPRAVNLIVTTAFATFLILTASAHDQDVIEASFKLNKQIEIVATEIEGTYLATEVHFA